MVLNFIEFCNNVLINNHKHSRIRALLVLTEVEVVMQPSVTNLADVTTVGSGPENQTLGEGRSGGVNCGRDMIYLPLSIIGVLCFVAAFSSYKRVPLPVTVVFCIAGLLFFLVCPLLVARCLNRPAHNGYHPV